MKNRGAHTMCNTKECSHFNKDGTLKRVGGTPRPQKKESGKDSVNFVQIIHSECKKVLCTNFHNESDSYFDSDF